MVSNFEFKIFKLKFQILIIEISHQIEDPRHCFTTLNIDTIFCYSDSKLVVLGIGTRKEQKVNSGDKDTKHDRRQDMI